MGCDIHSAVEILTDGKWTFCATEPFSWRSYGMFGFLADVRNYSHVPPIANQRGYPKDIDDATLIEIDDNFDHHSRSWLGLDELLAFDYDQTFEDRRCTKEVRAGYFDGAADSGPGKGEVTTFRK